MVIAKKVDIKTARTDRKEVVFEKVKTWAFRLLEHWAQILSQVPSDQAVPLDDINTSTTHRMVQALAMAVCGLVGTPPDCIFFQQTPPPGSGPIINSSLSYTTNLETTNGAHATMPPPPSSSLPSAVPLQPAPAPISAADPFHNGHQNHQYIPRHTTMSHNGSHQVDFLTAAHSNATAPRPLQGLPGLQSVNTHAFNPQSRHPSSSHPNSHGHHSASPVLSLPSAAGQVTVATTAARTNARTKVSRPPTESYLSSLKGSGITVDASEDPFWVVDDADPLAWVILAASQLKSVELTGVVKPGSSIVLRCYRFARGGPFQRRVAPPHEWPPELQVRITNTHSRGLVDMVKIRRSEKYKHYKDSYLDLTPHIQAGQNWFKVAFDSGTRSLQASFFLCAQAMHPVTPEQLANKLRTFNILSVEDSKKFIRESFARNDMVSFEKITLKDPQTLMRISTPARGIHCQHWGCFDLDVYLGANRNIRTWLCPRCNRSTPFDTLIIDAYFEEALKLFPEEEEIILNADASLKSIAHEKVPTTTNDSTDSIPSKPDSKVIVIDLLDSDDDDDYSAPPPAPAPRPIASPSYNSIPNTSNNPTINTTLHNNHGASASAGSVWGAYSHGNFHSTPSSHHPSSHSLNSHSSGHSKFSADHAAFTEDHCSRQSGLRLGGGVPTFRAGGGNGAYGRSPVNQGRIGPVIGAPQPYRGSSNNGFNTGPLHHHHGGIIDQGIIGRNAHNYQAPNRTVINQSNNGRTILVRNISDNFYLGSGQPPSSHRPHFFAPNHQLAEQGGRGGRGGAILSPSGMGGAFFPGGVLSPTAFHHHQNPSHLQSNNHYSQHPREPHVPYVPYVPHLPAPTPAPSGFSEVVCAASAAVDQNLGGVSITTEAAKDSSVVRFQSPSLPSKATLSKPSSPLIVFKNRSTATKAPSCPSSSSNTAVSELTSTSATVSPTHKAQPSEESLEASSYLSDSSVTAQVEDCANDPSPSIIISESSHSVNAPALTELLHSCSEAEPATHSELLPSSINIASEKSAENIALTPSIALVPGSTPTENTDDVEAVRRFMERFSCGTASQAIFAAENASDFHLSIDQYDEL